MFEVLAAKGLILDRAASFVFEVLMAKGSILKVSAAKGSTFNVLGPGASF